MKKGSSTLIASIMAAASSTVAFTSLSGDTDVSAVYNCSNEVSSSLRNDGRANDSLGRSLLSSLSSSSTSMEKEEFAPRFDGLRFIETLVTAHR